MTAHLNSTPVTPVPYKFRMFAWVEFDPTTEECEFGMDREPAVVIARSVSQDARRTDGEVRWYCVRYSDGTMDVWDESSLRLVKKLPAQQADALNEAAMLGEEGVRPDPADAARWSQRHLQLSHLNKGAVIARYRELGGLTPQVGEWRKDEVINAVIEMEMQARKQAQA